MGEANLEIPTLPFRSPIFGLEFVGLFPCFKKGTLANFKIRGSNPPDPRGQEEFHG